MEKEKVDYIIPILMLFEVNVELVLNNKWENVGEIG